MLVKLKKSVRTLEQNPVLRQHQNDALSAIGKVLRKGEGKGRIVLPTGTGKTRIEAEAICSCIKHNQKQGEWGGVHAMLVPRILLTYQQLDEFIGFFFKNGITCNYMLVHSGGLDSGEYEKKQIKLGYYNPDQIPSTTNLVAIKNIINSAKEKDIPLVIISTYHSVGRVKEAAMEAGVKIQSYIFDEAQYCVSAGPFQDIPYYDSRFKFYFTATEKETSSDTGLGMNNEEKFGRLLFTEKPITLIERGEMTSVAIHLVGTRGQNMEGNDYESMAKAVCEAFDKHRVVVKEHSADPDTIAPKMIVVCNKQSALEGIMRSKTMFAYKTDHAEIHLCALSSDFGIEVDRIRDPRVNNKGKEKLLKKMKEWSSTEEAIVLHVDMIAEGLNVPGVTAVMPFRNLGKIKFLQNMGRGTRLIDVDRNKLYSNEIAAKDWGKYVKPYCWLVLPVLSSDYYDQKKQYTDYITALKYDFGFKPNELVVIDNLVGYPKKDFAEDLAGAVKKEFNTGRGLIDEIIHSIEDSEILSEFMEKSFKFNSLKPDQQISMLRAIYA